MLLLTWRNLLARKVRLLMSTLAIVLGIGFLAGVMTFSSGLNKTFDNIIYGSTPDGVGAPGRRGAGRRRRGEHRPGRSPLPTSTSSRRCPRWRRPSGRSVTASAPTC